MAFNISINKEWRRAFAWTYRKCLQRAEIVETAAKTSLTVTCLPNSDFFFDFSAHPFAKKEWYNVLAPGFDKRCITLTPCNKTAGLVNSADSLRGRVFTTSLADCNNQAEANNWRKLKFQIDEIKGFDCYTNFYGMDITRDKACSMVKKWYSLIEAFVQAKT